MQFGTEQTRFTCPACKRGQLKLHRHADVPIRYLCRQCHRVFEAVWAIIPERNSKIEIAKDPTTGEAFELGETSLGD